MSIPNIRFNDFNDEWVKNKFKNLLKYEQPNKYIVKSEEYSDIYTTPVLTAGQSFLLGYINELGNLKNASEDNPVIIFDDFLTSNYLVDFPFKVKSSALKILNPCINTNIYFSYYLLKYINYIPECHERHWISKFIDMSIYTPSLPEQQKLGKYFNNIDTIIENQTNKLTKLEMIKKSLLNNLFPKKDSTKPFLRFKDFNDEYVRKQLVRIIEQIPSKKYIKEPDANGKYILLQQGSEPFAGYANGYPFYDYKNVVLFGDHTLSFYKPEEPFLLAGDGIKIIKSNSLANTYLYYLLDRYKPQSEGYKRHYNLLVDRIVSFTTNSHEQQLIGKYLNTLDKIINLQKQKLKKLKNIKQSLLNKLLI